MRTDKEARTRAERVNVSNVTMETTAVEAETAAWVRAEGVEVEVAEKAAASVVVAESVRVAESKAPTTIDIPLPLDEVTAGNSPQKAGPADSGPANNRPASHEAVCAAERSGPILLLTISHSHIAINPTPLYL